MEYKKLLLDLDYLLDPFLNLNELSARVSFLCFGHCFVHIWNLFMSLGTTFSNLSCLSAPMSLTREKKNAVSNCPHSHVTFFLRNHISLIKCSTQDLRRFIFQKFLQVFECIQINFIVTIETIFLRFKG